MIYLSFQDEGVILRHAIEGEPFKALYTYHSFTQRRVLLKSTQLDSMQPPIHITLTCAPCYKIQCVLISHATHHTCFPGYVSQN